MAQVTCTRCFAVFESDDARPGVVPLCPDCAPRAPGGTRPSFPAAQARAPSARRGRGVLLGLGALGAAAAVLALVLFLVRRQAPAAPRAPRAVDLRVEEWRSAGLLPATAVTDVARAELRQAAGLEALAADMPSRTAEGLQQFREAIALGPSRPDAAIGGYAFAFGESAGDEADGPELRATHELVREALARSPGSPELLAGYARLLLVVPSPANLAEAVSLATRAVRAAPRDPAARLALGLAQLQTDPVEAARTLEDGLAALPGDRRLLT
ncbi:MAG TPA: hypothetical protein VIW03_12755, partial [Anaeromyxobacter sp.]